MTLNSKPALFLYEWFFVLLVISYFLAFGMVHYLSRTPSLPKAEESVSLNPHAWIFVSIDGAVAHPGRYRIAKGSTFKDLFEIAQPLPSADLRKLKKDKVVSKNQRINVRFKE